MSTSRLSQGKVAGACWNIKYAYKQKVLDSEHVAYHSPPSYAGIVKTVQH